MAVVTPFPKSAQTARRGKPKVEEPPGDAPPKRGRTPRAQAPAFVSNEVSIDLIDHGRNPRLEATKPELEDLSESIKQHGILQPIRVRPIGDRYEVVMGHRRLEAARLAKFKVVPVVIATPTDRDAFVQSLVENLQRQDLTPLEEARAFQILLEEAKSEDPKATQEKLGKQLGRSQSYISNSIRLLGLEEPVKEALAAGKLTVAHAKAMAALPPAKQVALAQQSIASGLTSSELEDRIRRERESEKYAEQQRERVAEAVAALLPFAKKAPKGATLLAFSRDYVDGLAAAGIKVRSVDYSTDHTGKPYCGTCGCKAFLLQTYEPHLEPACIEPQHHEAWAATVRAQAEEKSKSETATLEKFRRGAVKALLTDDQVNIDGHRVVLYMLLTRAFGGYYGGNNSPVARFQSRHGGDPALTANRSLWETVQALSEKDLNRELVELSVNAVTPNVFSSQGRWEADKDPHIRLYFVDQFGLPEEAVWGNAERKEPVPAAEQEDDEDPNAHEFEPSEDDENVCAVCGEEQDEPDEPEEDESERAARAYAAIDHMEEPVN